MQGENYIILTAMLRKRGYFVKNVSSRSSGMGRSPAKIFILTTEISALAFSLNSSGDLASPLLNFFVKLSMCSFEKSGWLSYRVGLIFIH